MEATFTNIYLCLLCNVDLPFSIKDISYDPLKILLFPHIAKTTEFRNFHQNMSIYESRHQTLLEDLVSLAKWLSVRL